VQLLFIIALTDPDGLTENLTVLLPYDVDEIECETYAEDGATGAFVDGHQFEFRRDENGDRSFVSSY